jgi:hypothetical protein
MKMAEDMTQLAIEGAIDVEIEDNKLADDDKKNRR